MYLGIIILATLAVLFSLIWVITKDVSWEPFVVLLAAAATLIDAIRGFLEDSRLKKEQVLSEQQQKPEIPVAHKFVDTNGSEDGNKESSEQLIHLRKKLILATCAHELRLLEVELVELLKTDSSPNVYNMLQEVRAAIAFESRPLLTLEQRHESYIKEFKIIPDRFRAYFTKQIWMLIIIGSCLYMIFKIISYFIRTW